MEKEGLDLRIAVCQCKTRRGSLQKRAANSETGLLEVVTTKKATLPVSSVKGMYKDLDKRVRSQQFWKRMDKAKACAISVLKFRYWSSPD